ncbi:DUF3108 domain-containing protein [Nitratiruptor sp. SB155-2]|uniref:DUF3108 domain-containing protein n=1 Tax=Nitratiruptor sp. (strain SB155-2) TaxID=387092 RepID=UPI00015873AB|nr:DUF3108 domain-containing protein [Nitratiruptor sp. SB155-2]BAF70475.1 conserved hypothetical protein [Nitratiruptor sp. SB155-2]
MRYFYTFLFCTVTLFAKTIDAEYKVTFGLFGTVGKVHAHYESNATDYKILIKAKAVGMAKLFSHKRVEEYGSEGTIGQNGLLQPKLFYRIKQTTKRRDYKRYIFDYQNRKIILYTDKNKYGKFHVKHKELLPYFTDNDVLTLYFNLQKNLKPNRLHYRFQAVGGSEQNGKIDVDILQGKAKSKIKNLLKVDGLYLAVKLYQKIFASKEGLLYIVLDKDGIAKRGLLKDVIFFGDVKGILTKKEVRE